MSKFSDAFAAARKSGKKEFSYGGKRYHTRLKGESKSQWAKKLGGSSAAPKTAKRPRPAPTGKVINTGIPKSYYQFSNNTKKRPQPRGKVLPDPKLSDNAKAKRGFGRTGSR